MKKLPLILSLLLVNSIVSNALAQTIPQHDHVVIAVMENHAYSNIEGSIFAPYVNSLLGGTHTANLTSSHGLAHPSQPNYIMLFSGSDQGVTDDNVPSTWPFTTPNLGAELLDNGQTFIGYSEDLPAVGSNVASSGDYVRKHNPWVNWQDAPSNGIPSSNNLPFTSFPSDFSLLPTLSFVIPNLVHDMHNPILLPNAISNGDTWLEDNLDAYIQWAKTHNSLFILTFDEDDLIHSNHIMTLFIGENVITGDYNEEIDHYDVLRTLEDMYDLPHAGSSANATPITDIWVQTTTDIDVASYDLSNMNVYPDPASQQINMAFAWERNESVRVDVLNMLSQTVSSFIRNVVSGQNQFLIPAHQLENGIYFLRISSPSTKMMKKVMVAN